MNSDKPVDNRRTRLNLCAQVGGTRERLRRRRDGALAQIEGLGTLNSDKPVDNRRTRLNLAHKWAALVNGCGGDVMERWLKSKGLAR